MVFFRRGNGITMGREWYYHEVGNTITIRLVIPLPTRKNFGNPILLCNKQGGKNQNADLAK